MTASAIRRLLEALDGVGTVNEDSKYDLHHKALEIIEEIITNIAKSNPDLGRLMIDVNHLADTIVHISDLKNPPAPGQKTETKVETVASTLRSLAKQMAEPFSIKTVGNPVEVLKSALKALYHEIIEADQSFAELATTNMEARSKIQKLAALINKKATDPDTKAKSQLIYRQAGAIQ